MPGSHLQGVAAHAEPAPRHPVVTLTRREDLLRWLADETSLAGFVARPQGLRLIVDGPDDGAEIVICRDWDDRSARRPGPRDPSAPRPSGMLLRCFGGRGNELADVPLDFDEPTRTRDAILAVLRGALAKSG